MEPQPAAAQATVVVTETAPAGPVLRLRGAAEPASEAAPRVTWTADTVEINEYSGKKKSKSVSLSPTPPHRISLPSGTALPHRPAPAAAVATALAKRTCCMALRRHCQSAAFSPPQLDFQGRV